MTKEGNSFLTISKIFPSFANDYVCSLTFVCERIRMFINDERSKQERRDD
jgi:hypothetical protein